MVANIPPRHHDEPPRPTQGNPLTLFDPTGIKQLEGLYRLNDIHKMAGAIKKQSPNYYLDSTQGKEILKLYEENKNTENSALYICSIRGRGQNRGTYADFAIALDYAQWIDKRFFIVLSQYVKNANTPQPEITYTIRANMMEKERKGLKAHISDCASDLCVIGKQVLPALVREEKKLLNEMQPQLPLTGSNQ